MALIEQFRLALSRLDMSPTKGSGFLASVYDHLDELVDILDNETQFDSEQIVVDASDTLPMTEKPPPDAAGPSRQTQKVDLAGKEPAQSLQTLDSNASDDAETSQLQSYDLVVRSLFEVLEQARKIAGGKVWLCPLHADPTFDTPIALRMHLVDGTHGVTEDQANVLVEHAATKPTEDIKETWETTCDAENLDGLRRVIGIGYTATLQAMSGLQDRIVIQNKARQGRRQSVLSETLPASQIASVGEVIQQRPIPISNYARTLIPTAEAKVVHPSHGRPATSDALSASTVLGERSGGQSRAIYTYPDDRRRLLVQPRVGVRLHGDIGAEAPVEEDSDTEGEAQRRTTTSFFRTVQGLPIEQTDENRIKQPEILHNRKLSTDMGGIVATEVDGVGVLTYQSAIEIARNTEDDLDSNVADYLESAVNSMQLNIESYPDSYVLSKDEFAVFNYFRSRFSGEVAEHAVDRYWRSTMLDENWHSLNDERRQDSVAVAAADKHREADEMKAYDAAVASNQG
ncbi:hypothetical protein B0A48_03769 [Cryoendolithus antarcticus]|uniref:Uncharacterized protein n=1 Tax=Cryoendolithus antarcticus TaxID=1507870 RepID=A0A1V8TGX5_9PEZI|nr:hypothetical protein B0A48_03769 [Cryoendolithus antarcticus]